jgi:pyruvate dehydrogenase E2 component (dihydrolipoamide acetyltransferase)
VRTVTEPPGAGPPPEPTGPEARLPGVKGTVQIVEPTAAERTVARRAAESRATVPDLELSVEVDMGACLGLEAPQTAILVRAAALALREHPRANAAYRDGRFELYSRVNVGVTMVQDEMLVTATVFDADRKVLAELAAEIDELERRAPELTSPERSGATFTLTDLGRYGVSRASAIISAPQAAALAAGEIRHVPLVRDATVVPGDVMTLTLACDHRILYGAEAAGFLAHVRELLEQATL